MEAKEKLEKKNRVIEFVSKEHKYENLILAVLAIVAIELGVLILTKVLNIPQSAFLIGGELNSKIFSWALVVLGAVSLVLSVFSFFVPSFAETKHIKGLKVVEYLVNIATVIIFILILALFFIGCDAVIEKLTELLENARG
jgi:hypothetical protein